MNQVGRPAEFTEASTSGAWPHAALPIAHVRVGRRAGRTPALKICETRELLAAQYRMVPAPDPSRELLARMNSRPFLIASKDAERLEVLVPLAPRRARRLRYLVAATMASAFAMSGLAAAGALPAPLQRGAASVASVVSVDLPTPAAIRMPDVRHPRVPHTGRGQPTHPHAVPASPPVVDIGASPVAGTPAPVFRSGVDPSASAVASIPNQTVAPPSELPTFRAAGPCGAGTSALAGSVERNWRAARHAAARPASPARTLRRSPDGIQR